jgi:hypothetical protein
MYGCGGGGNGPVLSTSRGKEFKVNWIAWG